MVKHSLKQKTSNLNKQTETQSVKRTYIRKQRRRGQAERPAEREHMK